MLRQNITPGVEGSDHSCSVGEKMSDQVRRVVIGDQKRAFLDRPEVNHRSARHGFRGGNAQGEMDQLAGAGRIRGNDVGVKAIRFPIDRDAGGST